MQPIEIVIEEYKALRTEIAQSIAKQHWIAVGGYLLAGTTVAAVLEKTESNLEALLVIPLIFLSATCLWLVEANRMVRASYFIAYIAWPHLCNLCNHTYQGWEHWIRDEGAANRKFCRLQDIFQRTAVIVIPGILSITSIVYVGKFRSFNLWITVDIILTFGAFVTLFLCAKLVSNLAHIRHGDFHKPVNIPNPQQPLPLP